MKENFLEKWFYQYSYQMQQYNGINELTKLQFLIYHYLSLLAGQRFIKNIQDKTHNVY